VSDRLVCTSCGRDLEPPPDARQAWVECPFCKTRNVNPAAVQNVPLFRNNWAVVGTVLIILSGIGTLLAALALAVVLESGNFARDPLGEAIAGLVGCLLFVAVGVLLVIIGTRPADQPVGPGSTLVGAAVLAFVVGRSAVIYAFTACF
jgi:hypothetical protein